MSEKEIEEMSIRRIDKIVEAAHEDIADRQELIRKPDTRRMEKNLIYTQIENRKSIIKTLTALRNFKTLNANL
jgi:hypothetical protein